MNSQRSYAIISILVAALVISGSVASYYFTLYNQQVSISGTDADQLNQLSSKYDSVASSYNSLVSKYNSAVTAYGDVAARYNGSVASFKQLSSSYVASASEFESLAATYQTLLGDYNRSLYLLVRTVSVMNTSEPAYQNATRALKQLTGAYDNLTLQYGQIVERYDSLVANFQEAIREYQTSNNVTVIGQNPGQLRPVPASLLTVNVLVDQGDSTRRWYNRTEIQAGWNLYIATVVLLNGSLEATWYPQYGEHLINSINGVQNTAQKSWFLWTYNKTSSWQVAQAGADLIHATNGSSYAWTYCQFDQAYRPVCTP